MRQTTAASPLTRTAPSLRTTVHFADPTGLTTPSVVIRWKQSSILMKPTLPRLLLLGAAFLAATLSRANAAVDTKPDSPPRIAQGQTITLADHLVKGKITVVDFTSDYCPPCRAVSPKLDELHRRRDDVAVVKVDINRPDVRKIDWQSPVAKQFALRSIPHFKIFDGEGKLISEGDEARDTVYGWLKR